MTKSVSKSSYDDQVIDRLPSFAGHSELVTRMNSPFCSMHLTLSISPRQKESGLYVPSEFLQQQWLANLSLFLPLTATCHYKLSGTTKQLPIQR